MRAGAHGWWRARLSALEPSLGSRAGQLAEEPAAALRLIRVLSCAERLSRLSLAGNSLKPPAAEAIAEALLGRGERV